MKSVGIFLFISLLNVSLAYSQGAKKRVSVGKTVPKTGQPSQPGAAQPGLALYKQYCLTCHQADGGGVPRLNPSLRGTDWVTGDKTRLINVLLKGLQNVEIDGETYDNVMPAHDFLTDQQLADLLTYLRTNFGNTAAPISPTEVKQQRTP